ncbi:hypothetical protein [Aquimarina algicola]|uniref:Lipoprotein n=1 Tax=Aquimarina algicola TaxID=2589995 RepID=A0A504IZD1_9FLAO|nr:hypothetical protein [Aquimarina algicola]TPN83887.1 hypothetical protein FHK87_18140 [Aquimarina algicola]
MVNKFCLVVFSMFCLSSCGFFNICDHTGSIGGTGLRSKQLYKKYLKKRINPNDKEIRTDAVYQDLGYYYDEIEDTLVFKKNSKTYYRFYDSGNMYIYRLTGNDPIINKASFNPVNGDIGFVIDHKKNVIMNYTTMNCGSFVKTSFEVSNDTLIMKYGSGGEDWRVLGYYKVLEVPKEWLAYPDDIH